MTVRRVEAYRCSECDRLWDARQLADTCCLPEVDFAWDCGVDGPPCGLYEGEFHQSQTAAEQCAEAAEAASGCACGHPRRWHMGWVGAPALCIEGTCSCRAFEARVAVGGSV